MKPDFSRFGDRLCKGSGIEELMSDLGKALTTAGPDVKMLGGGQPAHIDAVDELWRRRMTEIMADGDTFEKMVGNYDGPQGNPDFIKALAKMLHEHFGWDITEKNIAITSGGQTAFFFLFNALAGRMSDGRRKKILLPIVPEYIGYSSQSVGEDFFHAVQPIIEEVGDREFKYRVDFDSLEISDDIAAMCVSRPTNPTGNVLTDNEMRRLADLAAKHKIPFIVDNAYGAPFPNIFFADANPMWDENIILTLSLSKIGLPGTRTGIVVANEEIASAVASISAIVGLANNNIGQAMMTPLVENGEILKLSNQVVKPFYLKKSQQAQQWLREFMDESIPFRYHVSEGALFLWLWFKDLPISSKELYERLKAREVLVVSGHYFFFGLPEDKADWKHADECIRMTYTMPEDKVKGGIEIIAEVLREVYDV